MEKLKNKKVGRPAYNPNIELLKKLYKQIENKEISNVQAYQIAKCGKTKWFEIKKKIKHLEAK